MLPNFYSFANNSYGFRFKGEHQQNIAGLFALGKEVQNSTSYIWDGMSRGEQDIVVFQYTLKGAGKIRIADQTHDLHPGDAFFVKIPSDHTYYLPKNSERWEFIYITLFGEQALHFYENITNKTGYIFNLDIYTPPIQCIFKTLEQVANQQMNDAYVTSAAAYDFLMKLAASVFYVGKEVVMPTAITKATAFMDSNYAGPISLDDIVEASGLSKYHFTRLFHQKMNTTPIQYLSKLRINHAMTLLKEHDLTIEGIALMVGFSNGNYFTKVFRSHVGVAPSVFRDRKTFSPVDYLISD